MSESALATGVQPHSHVFLAADHETSERRTWAVIALCGLMMVAEVVGGVLFGSIALVADGLHMSTHAGALLLAALAYRYARKHADDARFTFGTGKLGDLAGFTSAIVLAMIALLIGYESVLRLVQPVAIRFAEAIPIALLGLAVNLASAWLLGGARHGHGAHGHPRERAPLPQPITVGGRRLRLELFEHEAPPRFRLYVDDGVSALPHAITIETLRPEGTRQLFAMREAGRFLESIDEVPQPHSFTAHIQSQDGLGAAVFFEEHDDGSRTHRDNNLRAAIIHVAADAAVSVCVIAGLVLARTFGWLWMDPVAGIVGAIVIAAWSYALIRDTGAILLDIIPDRKLAENLRSAIEVDGDRVRDLHLWRVGPGHVAAIVSVVTSEPREAGFYRARLERFQVLSHVTVEVSSAP